MALSGNDYLILTLIWPLRKLGILDWLDVFSVMLLGIFLNTALFILKTLVKIILAIIAAVFIVNLVRPDLLGDLWRHPLFNITALRETIRSKIAAALGTHSQ